MQTTWMRMVVLAGMILVVPACGSSGSNSDPGDTSVFQAPVYSDPGIETFPSEGRTHVPVGTTVVYNTDPPTSGNHYPSPQAGGYYETPIAAGYLVHSLEHGGIVIYYDPSIITTPQKDSLKAMAKAHPGIFGQVVCVPRNDPSFPIILTAWTHWLRLASFDQSRMNGFVTLFMGQGPEAPWGTPTSSNVTSLMYYASGYYFQISDTARPGFLTTNNGMTYTAASSTFSIDLRATSASTRADTQSIRFLSDPSAAILAEAVYNASTGAIVFSIGTTTFPAMSVTPGSYHSVTFHVDSGGAASWAVDGAATGSVAFGNPIVSMELDVNYEAGSGAAPDFFFGNTLVTNP